MAGTGGTKVPISKLSESESLLVRIVEEDDEKPKAPIEKVPFTLREVKTNETCFDPTVVSLGPYHRPKPLDSYKESAVRWFVSLWPGPDSGGKVKKIYKDFVMEASRDKPLKNWYAADDENIEQLEDEELAIMMFLDGCFILHFVHHYFMKRSEDWIKKTRSHQPFIVSDMFLLENQIPFAVLKSLMDLMPDPNTPKKQDIENFIQQLFLIRSPPICWTFDQICRAISSCLGKKRDPDNPSTSNSADKDPLHVLDILRTKLIGTDPVDPVDPVDNSPESHDYFFRSIVELKAKGIKLRKSQSNSLSKMKFHEGLIYGHLSLPEMIVDDGTKTKLLNLIAYEMCPGRPPDFKYVITSYVSFLDSLIDHADDVKELRSKGILLNCLGSDEEVAKLFNEVATNLVDDPAIYRDIKSAIQRHCKLKLKVWIAEMLHTHFSTPWTVISLIAVIFLLFLTVVQTIFSVW